MRKTIALMFCLAACTAQQDFGIFHTPSSGPSRAIGSYTNGCLAGAQALPPDGPGYQVMRPSRERFYGTPALIAYIEILGRRMAAQGEGILVGDMAPPRGGPMPSGHASHQTGLDVDLWYTSPTHRLSAQEREQLPAASLVQADGQAVDVRRWRTRYVTLLKAAASAPEVERIFVHPTIKRQLCRSVPGAVWLHKIRPWWGHDEHFHVRLQCPTDDAECEPQPDTIPEGDGCDATLDWWFSDEAKAQAQQPHEVPMSTRPMDRMPAACRTVAASP